MVRYHTPIKLVGESLRHHQGLSVILKKSSLSLSFSGYNFIQNSFCTALLGTKYLTYQARLIDSITFQNYRLKFHTLCISSLIAMLPRYPSAFFKSSLLYGRQWRSHEGGAGGMLHSQQLACQ